ncbi:hypothetical protein [Kitasatospora sp. NPDC101183]|uniref:hypothetical protein n=1 Tax=Kitasatospora sp. NPDC101183 TaxID=3364100 RepID=UPI00381B81A0
MYLVHAVLRRPAAGGDLPESTALLLRTLAESVEHVAVHRDVRPDAVVGIYLLADSLAAAEQQAAELCRRAVKELPELCGWTVGRVGVPLVAPFYERLLSGSGLPGRIGPGTFPST